MASARPPVRHARRRPASGHPRSAGGATSPRIFPVAVLLTLVLGGCAGGSREADAALRSRLAELEQQNRELGDRLARAEGSLDTPTAPREGKDGCAASEGPGSEGSESEGEGPAVAEGPTGAKASARGRPNLAVVKLVPGGTTPLAGEVQPEAVGAAASESAAPEEPDSVAVPVGHRPLLRLHGSEEPKLRTVPVGKDEPQAGVHRPTNPRSGHPDDRPAGAASRSEPKLG